MDIGIRTLQAHRNDDFRAAIPEDNIAVCRVYSPAMTMPPQSPRKAFSCSPRHKGRVKPPGHHQARPFLGLLEASEMRWIIDRAFSLSLTLTLTLSQHLAVDNVSRAAAPSSMRSSDLAMTWQNRPPPSTICLYAFWLCFVRRPPCLIVSPSLAPPRPPHPERNALKLKERLRRSRSPPPRRAWVRSLRLSGPPRKRTRRRGDAESDVGFPGLCLRLWRTVGRTHGTVAEVAIAFMAFLSMHADDEPHQPQGSRALLFSSSSGPWRTNLETPTRQERVGPRGEGTERAPNYLEKGKRERSSTAQKNAVQKNTNLHKPKATQTQTCGYTRLHPHDHMSHTQTQSYLWPLLGPRASPGAPPESTWGPQGHHGPRNHPPPKPRARDERMCAYLHIYICIYVYK